VNQNSDKSNYIQLFRNNSQHCSVVPHRIQNIVVARDFNLLHMPNPLDRNRITKSCARAPMYRQESRRLIRSGLQQEPHHMRCSMQLLLVCYVTRWYLYKKNVVILNTPESLRWDSGQNCQIT